MGRVNDLPMPPALAAPIQLIGSTRKRYDFHVRVGIYYTYAAHILIRMPEFILPFLHLFSRLIVFELNVTNIFIFDFGSLRF